MSPVTAQPTLVVVSGPPGAGKTTLAHRLAAAIGCPAICRDEIKEGMAHAVPGFTAGPGDELTRRTNPVFFAVLDLLLRAGVTTVAEAAFQDHGWRPGLEPLLGLARIRVLRCHVGADVAAARIARRAQDDPLRRAHPAPRGHAEREAAHRAFRPVSIGAPALEVDTEDEYRPSFGQILSFIGKDLYRTSQVFTPRPPQRCSGSGPRAARPPSTGRTAPVMKLAWPDSRYATQSRAAGAGTSGC
jgi:predicted kinase